MSLAILACCEDLAEALGHLQVEAEELGSSCRQTCAQVEEVNEQVCQSLQEVETQIADATETVQECEIALEEAQQACERAHEELASARAALASARSAASSKLSRSGDAGDDREDDNEAEIAQAEEEVSEAETRCEEANANREVCAKQLEAAKAKLVTLVETRGRVQQSSQETAQMLAELHTEYSSRISRVTSLVEEAQRRLRQAQEAMDKYLQASPSASAVARWLVPDVKNTSVLRPEDLHSRLRLNSPQMYQFLGYLEGKDAGFRAKIHDYRQQLHACHGSAEILQVQGKVRKYMSGYLGEAVANHALRPYVGNVSTQARTYFTDGRYTKTDLFVEGLKVPVVLGKGAGRYAPQGGSIGIEVKCGHPEYLYSQKEHLLFQSGGHKSANAALTLCSADIQDLPEEKQQELREELAKAGSPVLGMLPKKDDMDEACWAYVNGIPPKE